MNDLPKTLDDIIIYSEGFINLSVCAINTKTRAEILEFVQTTHPSGTSNNWQFSNDATFNGGVNNPCLCDKLPEYRTHYLMTC